MCALATCFITLQLIRVVICWLSTPLRSIAHVNHVMTFPTRIDMQWLTLLSEISLLLVVQFFFLHFFALCLPSNEYTLHQRCLLSPLCFHPTSLLETHLWSRIRGRQSMTSSKRLQVLLPLFSCVLTNLCNRVTAKAAALRESRARNHCVYSGRLNFL